MSQKPFVMHTQCQGGTVNFGMLKRLVWIRVDLESGETFSTIDDYKRAIDLAAGMLHTDLWPGFASHLKPSHQMDVLFDWAG